MDNRRGVRDNLSYASLATGPSHYNSTRDRDRDRDDDRVRGGHRSFDERPQTPTHRPGGRGNNHITSDGRGRGRGRGRYDNDRYGRGGRCGPSISNGLRDRDRPSSLATNPVHAERFQPSPTAAAAAAAAIRRPTAPSSNASASPDPSGYESGEIMPGPSRPVARRRGSGGNSIPDGSGGSHDGGRGIGSTGKSLDGRGPGGRYGGRGGRGRGGRFVDRGGAGGRGRGPAGRSDFRGSYREGRDSYTDGRREDPLKRFIEPPREVEFVRKDPHPRRDDRGMPPRDRPFLPRDSPHPPRDPPVSKRDPPLPPRDSSRDAAIDQPTDPIGGSSRMKYPPGPASDLERSGPPGRFRDLGPEYRQGKRPRDETGYHGGDYDDKRFRSNDHSLRSRPVEEHRSYSPPIDARTRISSDFRRLDDDRPPPLKEPRDSYDLPPRREGPVGGPPPIRFNSRDRPGPDDGPSRYGDSRGPLIEEPRTRSEDEVVRYNGSLGRPLDEPSRGHLPPFDGPSRMMPHRDDLRGAPPPPPPPLHSLPARNEMRNRMVYRDEAAYRDNDTRHSSSQYDIPREPIKRNRDGRSIPADKDSSRSRGPTPPLDGRDGIRDGLSDSMRGFPRDRRRDFCPRDGHRDFPRESHREDPREISRGLPLDIPKDSSREKPRHIAWELSRDTPRDVPRELPRDVPRESPRDLPRESPRDLPKDRPRDPLRHEGRTGSVFGRESHGRPPVDSRHDRTNLPPPPPPMDMDRRRDLRGSEEYRSAPPGRPAQLGCKPRSSALSVHRSPLLSSGSPHRGPPPRDEPPRPRPPFRDDPGPADRPMSDPLVLPPASYVKRDPYLNGSGGPGRSEGSGGRGFQRDGPGRGRGRASFGRFAPPRSHDSREREGPPDPNTSRFCPVEDSWNTRQVTITSAKQSWKDGAPWQERDQPHGRTSSPPHSGPSTDDTTPLPSSNVKEEEGRKTESEEPANTDFPIKTESEKEKGPRPISPPPPGKPSGVVMALARLADLEAQMEYAYVKHMQLVKRQKELQQQAKVLETLPVGIEAFKEELDSLNATVGSDTEKV